MVDFVELKDINKDKRRAKRKKFFKTVGRVVKKGAVATGRGAREIGTSVAKGSGALVKKAVEAQSPEAQERRLEAQEQKLVVQERIAKRRARIVKLQPQGGGMFGGGGGGIGGMGGGGGFGLKKMDMSNVLTGEPPKKRKGKPFDPFSQI